MSPAKIKTLKKPFSILEQDAELIWHPFSKQITQLPMLLVKRARGVFLETNRGRILDGISSWWVNLHGHGRREIAQAIAKQAKILEQVIFAGFTHQPAIDLISHLKPLLPLKGGMKKAFFSDNGSTSIEVALKMAIQYWKNKGEPRRTILAFEGAYHGDTFGAMSLAGPSLFNLPFEDFLFEVVTLPYPEINKATKATEALDQILKKYPKPALMIYEPLVQGSAGMRMASAKSLAELLKKARQKGALLIADEVMTGFGRTGQLFASEAIKERPDLMCLSKGITGGFLPMGVTAVNPKVYEAFHSSEAPKTFYHGHSYTASPLACAAANASLKLLLSKRCTQARASIEKEQVKFLAELRKCPQVENARVCGTILAFEVLPVKKKQETTQVNYLSSLRDPLYLAFLKEGILLRPLGNTVYVLPPYVIKKTELRNIHQVILRVIQEF